MNEIYPDNQTPQVPTPPAPTQQPGLLNKNIDNWMVIKVDNWIILIYFVLLAVTWFNSDPTLSGYLFWAMLAFAFLAAGSFTKKMFNLNKGTTNIAAKVFMGLVGTGGAIVIFIIGFFFAVGNWFSTHPIQGD